MSDVQTNTNLPETFDFNETDLVRAPKEQYAVGFYKGVITKAEKKLCPWGTNDLGIEITLQAVDTNDALQTASVRYWLGIPVRNPSVPGHKVDDKQREVNGDTLPSAKDSYFLKAREFIRTIMGRDALPQFPKRKEGTDLYVDPATGEAMDITQRKAREMEVNKATVTCLQTWYTDPSQLVDNMVYFATKRNDKGYAKVSYVAGEPNGKDVKYSDFV